MQCDQIPAELVTFTEEIRNGKLHFLCSEKNLINNYFALNQSLKCFVSIIVQSLFNITLCSSKGVSIKCYLC